MWGIAIMMMVVGFLLGVIFTDTYKDDQRVSKLEREVNRLKRRIEAAE